MRIIISVSYFCNPIFYDLCINFTDGMKEKCKISVRDVVMKIPTNGQKFHISQQPYFQHC